MSHPESSAARRFCLILGAVFGCLLLVERCAPFVLPVGYFYFRPWEYMESGRRSSVTMRITDGYGVLANMIGLRRYRAYRSYTWTNDAYGMHNPPETQHEYPEIVVGGDSFMAGAADSDDALFAVQLQRLTGRPTTTYANATLMEYLSDPRFRQHPPHILVWGNVETKLTDEFFGSIGNDTSCDISARKGEGTSAEHPSRIVAHPFMTYAEQSLLRRFSWPLVAEAVYRLSGQSTPDVIIANDGSKMLFHAEGMELLAVPGENRPYTMLAEALRHAQDCLQSRGTRLLFLPIPSKEHLYHPLQGQDPFDVLRRKLREEDVHFVDVLPAFTASTQSGSSLYWTDDTHWNGRGMGIAATMVAETLRRSAK